MKHFCVKLDLVTRTAIVPSLIVVPTRWLLSNASSQQRVVVVMCFCQRKAIQSACNARNAILEGFLTFLGGYPAVKDGCRRPKTLQGLWSIAWCYSLHSLSAPISRHWARSWRTRGAGERFRVGTSSCFAAWEATRFFVHCGSSWAILQMT